LVEITGVLKDSPAGRAGMRKGYFLRSINGHEIRDVLDYGFYAAEERLIVACVLPGGEERTFRIKKGTYEDLGLFFSSYLMDKPMSCRNQCIFCFIDQLPAGLRKPLYFKDDDARLSFLTGNYITMTNLSDEDLERIALLKISPVNISVHTTNEELRVFMLKNKAAAKINRQMRFLSDHGIEMNCQIVLCKGVNDGKELSKSLRDLVSLYPHVKSVSVVPAGLTRYREGLFLLSPFTKEDAGQILSQIESENEVFLKTKGSRIVYPADEFFLLAERKIPPVSYYEDFPQIENGVGLLSSLKDEFDEAVSDVTGGENPPASTLVTGMAAYPFLSELVDELKRKCHNLHMEVIGVKNHFFGEDITVAGLLTGRDILNALRGKNLGENLLIASSMLRSEQDKFLDDITPQDLENELSVRVVIVQNNGFDFVEKIMKGGASS
jgi:putative radical SAM enzyme (TIGR03279 family)